MTSNVKPMVASVGNGIWVGNVASASQTKFINDMNIAAIVNLTGRFPESVHDDVDYFDYMLPSQELMNNEFPKTITKLESIAGDIKDIRDNNKNVLIYCYDGKNKCILAAAYYLITHCGKDVESVIESLEQLYFTEEQKREEQESKLTIQSMVPEDQTVGVALSVNMAAVKKREERNAIRCLTLSSFKKILRMRGKK